MQMRMPQWNAGAIREKEPKSPGPQTASWKKATYLPWSPDYPWTIHYLTKKVPLCFSLCFLGLCYSTLAFTQTNIYHVWMRPCSTTPCCASSWSQYASAPECGGKQIPILPSQGSDTLSEAEGPPGLTCTKEILLRSLSCLTHLWHESVIVDVLTKMASYEQVHGRTREMFT